MIAKLSCLLSFSKPTTWFSESRASNTDNTLALISFTNAAIGDLSYGWDESALVYRLQSVTENPTMCLANIVDTEGEVNMPILLGLLRMAKILGVYLGIGVWRVGMPMAFLILLVDYYYRRAATFEIDEVMRLTWIRLVVFSLLGAYLEYKGTKTPESE